MSYLIWSQRANSSNGYSIYYLEEHEHLKDLTLEN